MTQELKLCRVCGESFTPPQWRMICNDWLCKSCGQERSAAYRAKRRAEGRPVRTGQFTTERYREWAKEYTQREDVKRRIAERARLRRQEPSERSKVTARRAVRSAIEKGLLTRQPCEVCGAEQAEAHHDDYSKPVDVRWLCRLHHREHHAKATGQQVAK